MIRSIRKSCSFLVVAVSIGAGCVTPYASAADDIVTLDIGGYRFNSRNDISVGGPTSRGTEFRVEREGTPEDDSVLRLDGTIRFYPKHRIRFMYLNSTREGSGSTDRDITFRDSSIPAGTPVNTGFTLREAELDYMYSFYKTEATEVALSLGVHATRMEARISAPTLSISKESEATGPLPMIGVAANHRIQKWDLFGHVYGLKLKVNDFDGSALAYRAAVRYFFTPNFGVGIAYAGINYNFDVTKDSWLGSLDASNRGGEVFLSVRY